MGLRVAFLLYDGAITFDREVDLFWRGTITGATVLFIVNKYAYLMYCALGLVVYLLKLPMSKHVCPFPAPICPVHTDEVQ